MLSARLSLTQARTGAIADTCASNGRLKVKTRWGCGVRCGFGEMIRFWNAPPWILRSDPKLVNHGTAAVRTASRRSRRHHLTRGRAVVPSRTINRRAMPSFCCTAQALSVQERGSFTRSNLTTGAAYAVAIEAVIASDCGYNPRQTKLPVFHWCRDTRCRWVPRPPEVIESLFARKRARPEKLAGSRSADNRRYDARANQQTATVLGDRHRCGGSRTEGRCSVPERTLNLTAVLSVPEDHRRRALARITSPTEHGEAVMLLMEN